MTAIDLLNALKAYTEDKVKDMRLITRVPENGTDPGERPPLVFIGNLPNKEQEKKAAPYILLKLLTKKVDDEENVCRVRIICVTFSEDKNENYMQCLNLVTKIEVRRYPYTLPCTKLFYRFGGSCNYGSKGGEH